MFGYEDEKEITILKKKKSSAQGVNEPYDIKPTLEN